MGVEKRIIKRIGKLRRKMHDLIYEKSSLIDMEVVKVSQELDSVLNQYHQIQQKKPLQSKLDSYRKIGD